jgi:hypothetical protein
MDTRHLLVYLSWNVLFEWKRRRKEEGADRVSVREAAPFAYGSDQVTLYNNARPGDVVWVFSAPRFSRYRLPPSLIARLHVSDVIDQDNLEEDSEVARKIPDAVKKWRYVVLGDRSRSTYFPLNNAYSVLTSIEFGGASKTIDPETCTHCRKLIASGKQIFSGIPAHLQRVRRLARGFGADVERYAAQVKRGRMVFLSYRRRDASRMAGELVRKLEDRSVYCWLDNLMMPRRVAGGKIKLKKALMTDTLSDGLRQTTMFLALVTRSYNKSEWTSKELGLAAAEKENPRRTRPLKLVEVLMGGDPSGRADVEIPAEAMSAEEMADEVVKSF